MGSHRPTINVEYLMDEAVQYELCIRKQFNSKDNKQRRRVVLRALLEAETNQAEPVELPPLPDTARDIAELETIFEQFSNRISPEPWTPAHAAFVESMAVHMSQRWHRMDTSRVAPSVAGLGGLIDALMQQVVNYYDSQPPPPPPPGAADLPDPGQGRIIQNDGQLPSGSGNNNDNHNDNHNADNNRTVDGANVNASSNHGNRPRTEESGLADGQISDVEPEPPFGQMPASSRTNTNRPDAPPHSTPHSSKPNHDTVIVLREFRQLQSLMFNQLQQLTAAIQTQSEVMGEFMTRIDRQPDASPSRQPPSSVLGSSQFTNLFAQSSAVQPTNGIPRPTQGIPVTTPTYNVSPTANLNEAYQPPIPEPTTNGLTASSRYSNPGVNHHDSTLLSKKLQQLPKWHCCFTGTTVDDKSLSIEEYIASIHDFMATQEVNG